MTQNYSQFANPNATNSELDAKVVITPDHVTLDQNVNKYPRLNDSEWDAILDLVDAKLERQYYKEYQTIRDKLVSYRNEDEIVNRLCDTNISDYDLIPDRY